MATNDDLNVDVWKAKHIKDEHERIEIRKTIRGVQLLLVVYKKSNPVEFSSNNREEWLKRHQDIKLSMNGKLDMTWDEWQDLNEAAKEAFEIYFNFLHN